MSLYRVSNDIKSNWASIMTNIHAVIPFNKPDTPLSQPGYVVSRVRAHGVVASGGVLGTVLYSCTVQYGREGNES